MTENKNSKLKKSPIDSIDEIEIIGSKEYGASKSIYLFARQLELDQIISSEQTQWQANILSLIIGHLVYPGCNEISLISKYVDSILWDHNDPSSNTKPDLFLNCYKPLANLLLHQESIQKKLVSKFTLDKYTFVYYFPLPSEKQSFAYILTNYDGCPLAVNIERNHTNTIENQQAFFKSQFGLNTPIFISRFSDFESPADDSYTHHLQANTITELSRRQIANLFSRTNTIPDLCSHKNQQQIFDPHFPSIRYLLFVNKEAKKHATDKRRACIKKVKQMLTTLSKQKNIGVDLRKLAENILIEHRAIQLFTYQYTEKKSLEFEVNKGYMKQEEDIDGCQVIAVNIENCSLSAKDILHVYNRKIQMLAAFETYKLFLSENNLYNSNDFTHARTFLFILTYYLQWHMQRKLFSPSRIIGTKTYRHIGEVVEKLKSIRSQTVHINTTHSHCIVTKLNKDHLDIIAKLDIYW